MKKQSWLILFGIILLLNAVAVQERQLLLEQVSKPLLMPCLIGYWYSQTGGWLDSLKKWIYGALFFSWIGDVLLLFQDKAETWFLAGLAAFLVAHVFYILFFQQLGVRESIRNRPLLLLPVIIYYGALISWLSPYLGDKKLPVRLYGIVISFMFMLALHMLFMKKRRAGVWMAAGALLFLISDTLLAINKFYRPFAYSGISIMVTYGLAQLFIVFGAVLYMRQANSN